MAQALLSKVVSALPATLTADTVYFVRVGTGFDVYVTNHSGTIVAYPQNKPSGGGSALDGNNNLPLPAATGVTTPATGAIAERVITRAGFPQLGYGTADFPDITAMMNPEQYSVAYMESNGSTTSYPVNCQVASAGSTGTFFPTFATYTTSRPFTRYYTATTAAAGASCTLTVGARYRGNGSRRGGFYSVIKFMPILLTGHSAMIGMFSNGFGLGTEPSADTGAILALLCDSTDTNWQIFSKPSGSAGTKFDTGVSKAATGALYALYLYSPPNGGAMQWQFDNEEANTSLSGSFTQTLPTTTTNLSVIGVRMRNGSTTTSEEIQVNRIYTVGR